MTAYGLGGACPTSTTADTSAASLPDVPADQRTSRSFCKQKTLAFSHGFGIVEPSSDPDEHLIDSGPSERTARLRRWDDAPSGRTANPQEDHLIALMVVVGAAEGPSYAWVPRCSSPVKRTRVCSALPMRRKVKAPAGQPSTPSGAAPQ